MSSTEDEDSIPPEMVDPITLTIMARNGFLLSITQTTTPPSKQKKRRREGMTPAVVLWEGSGGSGGDVLWTLVLEGLHHGMAPPTGRKPHLSPLQESR